MVKKVLFWRKTGKTEKKNKTTTRKECKENAFIGKHIKLFTKLTYRLIVHSMAKQYQFSTYFEKST